MKKKILPIVLSALLCQTIVPADASDMQRPFSTKLDATKFQIVDETISHVNATKRGAEILFDSQGELPETPEKANIKITGKTWQPNWVVAWGEPSAIIDLGAYYMVSDVGYMDMNGSPEVSLFSGEPFAWEELGELPTNYYNSYRVAHFDQNKPTRYIRIVSKSSDTGINELGIYGFKVRDLTEADDAVTAAKPTAAKKEDLTSGQKIGANAFCDDPFNALDALGNVREYYNWSWLTQKDGLHYFNNIVNKDHYYQTLHDMNISVIPCMQMNSPALLSEDAEWNKVKNTMPVKEGADTLDPASYAFHSNMMYNFAARYGNNPSVDPKTLSVGDDMKIGMNILNTIESWNEQDKTWESKASYFHPYEYAAMLSADYDGHEGTIINGGVKNADPEFKLAMGGLAGGDDAVSYLSLMKMWFDYNRTDGQFAADVINYHDYITDTQVPEDSDFRDNARAVVAWMEEHAPGREVWLSEFDVIADDKKIAGLNEHDNEAYAKARAERLLRAFLVGEREGLDRMSMFMLRDEWSGVYANSGLTTGKGDWDKKTSWYYIASATDTLKNADLIRWSEQDDIYIYTYQDRDTSELIYALWSPTADGSSIEDYELTIGAGDKATQVTPAYGIKEGAKQPLSIQNQKVRVNVSETPIFVKVSGADVPVDAYPQKLIQVQEIRLGEENGSVETLTFDNREVVDLAMGETPSTENFMLTQFYHLFDEQGETQTAQTPWQKTRVRPETEMGAVAIKKEQSYPYDCIITFDDVYDLTYLGIYDTYATGRMDFYDDVTGDLIYRSNLDTYNCWNMIPLTGKTISTNRVRIVKYDGAKLNEVAFYGTPSNRKIGIDVAKQPGVIGQAHSDAKARLDIAGVSLGEYMSATKKLEASVLEAFSHLFDEQGNMPQDSEQALNKGTGFSTNFANIWGSEAKFPYDAVVALKKRAVVSKAAIFLGWGENEGKFEIYDNETGKLLVSQTLQGKGKLIYLNFEEPVETSSLRIVKYNSRTYGELSFYGDPI